MAFNLEQEHQIYSFCISGHLEKVKSLIKDEPSLVNVAASNGLTPVLFAAQAGQMEVVQWLLGPGGAKVNEKANDGMTVLHLAVQSQCLDMVKWLLQDGGINVDEQNHDGDTALLLAARASSLDIFKIIANDPLVTLRMLRDCLKVTNIADPIKTALDELISFRMSLATSAIRKFWPICPINQEVIADVMVAKDGQAYESSAIINWLETEKASPVTGEPLVVNDLYLNVHLQNMINEKMKELDVVYQKLVTSLSSNDYCEGSKVYSADSAATFFQRERQGGINADVLVEVSHSDGPVT